MLSLIRIQNLLDDFVFAKGRRNQLERLKHFKDIHVVFCPFMELKVVDWLGARHIGKLGSLKLNPRLPDFLGFLVVRLKHDCN